MAKGSYKIEFIDGQPIAGRRGIAWLKNEQDSRIDAEAVFKGLPTNDQRYLQASMDAWISGKPDINSRYHGWPSDPTYKDCQVFKWREGRVRHRIYGFKTHPGIPDGRFELCVLAMHATKSKAATDPFYKNSMNSLRDDADIQNEIRKQVKDLFDKLSKIGSKGKNEYTLVRKKS